MPSMKPVQVSVDVRHEPQAVFDFLDVMANHEPFTDHMLIDWSYSGPPSGIGSKAQITSKVGPRAETIDMEVIAAESPRTIVERNVGAKGRRVGTGTYTLEPLPGGGTKIIFEYAWQQAPLSERLLAPLVRSYLRRGNSRAMQRLAELLDARLGKQA
jgi:hypothetical protein